MLIIDGELFLKSSEVMEIILEKVIKSTSCLPCENSAVESFLSDKTEKVIIRVMVGGKSRGREEIENGAGG